MVLGIVPLPDMRTHFYKGRKMLYENSFVFEICLTYELLPFFNHAATWKVNSENSQIGKKTTHQVFF